MHSAQTKILIRTSKVSQTKAGKHDDRDPYWSEECDGFLFVDSHYEGSEVCAFKIKNDGFNDMHCTIHKKRQDNGKGQYITTGII